MPNTKDSPRRFSLAGKWPFLLVILVGVALDLWSKSYAFSVLSPKESRTVIEGFFNLVHVENSGAVGGLFGDHPGLLVAARFLAMAVLIYLVLRISAKRWFLQLSFALIIAGAAGNLYDNLFYGPEGAIGPVRDFIELRLFFLPFDTIPGLMYDKRWNAFNIADAMIVCGAISLFVTSFFGAPKKTQKNC